MCSWCGTTAAKTASGRWVRVRVDDVACPRCQIAPRAPGVARVVVADPPWRFRDHLPGAGRGAAKHYPTLSTPEICGFLGAHHAELPPLADDAILFLWRVAAMPREALRVCAAWGFEPKAELVWVKNTPLFSKLGFVGCDGRGIAFGLGHYTRSAHETCVIATRGRGARLVRDRSIRSVFFAARGRHSEKPPEFYALVERMARGPYLELFARTPRAGWHQHGNELPARKDKVAS